MFDLLHLQIAPGPELLHELREVPVRQPDVRRQFRVELTIRRILSVVMATGRHLPFSNLPDRRLQIRQLLQHKFATRNEKRKLQSNQSLF